ncbi:MAG: MoaD/ThiS family protein [Eubacteriaceae bacterium]|nr:MoaD/ThiS family protein [Eubacteriaceae bacterium]
MEREISAPGDVWSLLQALAEEYGAQMRAKLFTPDGGDIGMDAIILVNGMNVAHLKGKSTELSEGDTVAIFPMVAGG